MTGAVAYTLWSIAQSSREGEEVQAEYAEAYGRVGSRRPRQILTQVGLIIVGLALLVVGSRWLVHGAVAMATVLGLSELIIGLTIVAVGTSLPEVATSVVASLRGERDIAVGNIVGSNLFNILIVLGLAALITPTGITVSAAVLSFDIPVMIAVNIACLPIFFTGHVISRWEGALFIAYYVAYALYLMLEATDHDALPIFSAVMLMFVVPLTMLTLAILVARLVWTDRSTTGRS
jgi:cation:H+ antiporter